MPYTKRIKRPAYLPSNKSPYTKQGQRFHAERRWRVLSERIRAKRLVCEPCQYLGIVTPCTCVDHAIRIGNKGAKYDKRNLIAMCNEHHAYKTTIEIQGYTPDVISTHSGAIPYDIDTIIEVVALQSWLPPAKGDPDGEGVGGLDLWI